MAVENLVDLGSLVHRSEVRGQEESDRGHVKVFRILSDLSASSNRTSETSQRGATSGFLAWVRGTFTCSFRSPGW